MRAKHRLYSIAADVAVTAVLSTAVVYGAYSHQYHRTAPAKAIEIQTVTQAVTEQIYLVPDRTNMPEISEDNPYTQDFAPRIYDFIPLSDTLQTDIQRLCLQYEIAYDLCLAVIKTESEFTENIVGASGEDFGLCQINAATWEQLAWERGLKDYRTDSVQNVEMALIVLNICLTQSDGDLTVALNYYNSGQPSEVEYPDGTTYSGRVYANYKWITDQLDGQ